MRFYNEKIGYKIIDIIYSLEPYGIGRNELVRVSGYAKDTIDDWRNRLIEFGHIRIDSKGRMYLKEDAIQKYRDGNLIIPSDIKKKDRITKSDRITRKKYDLNERERSIIILILSIAAFDSDVPIRLEKAIPGAMVSYNPINDERYLYTRKTLPGFAISDITKKTTIKQSFDSNSKSYFLPENRINFFNNELFGYFEITKDEAIGYVDRLEKYKPPILYPIDQKIQGETRYIIKDQILNNFVKYCISIYNTTIIDDLLNLYKDRKISKEQLSNVHRWLTKLYGNNSMSRSIFYKKPIQSINELSEKENIEKILGESKYSSPIIIKYMNDIDFKQLPHMINRISEKYPFILSIFIETLFPNFIEEILKKAKKDKTLETWQRFANIGNT